MEQTTSEGKTVLDVCCGGRMMWFDRQHPAVVFGDQRRETLTVTDRSHGRADGTRELRIEPDTLLDFRALPYPDESFWHVAFDPPHLDWLVFAKAREQPYKSVPCDVSP